MAGGKTSAGFTLLELLSVIVILGILSAVAVAHLDIDPFRTASFEQELRSALRFGQKFAIASGCDVQVTVDAGGYNLKIRNDANAGCLTATGAFGTFLKNPTGGTFSAAPPSGVTVSAASFTYDRQGRPSGGGNVTITVDTQTITIEAVTGYVH
jgi:MSHA pilin protein MshC